MFIEATRRVSRRAVERIRDAFIEYDLVVFQDVQVDVPAALAYEVIRDGRTFVLAVNDPSIQVEHERLFDCGD